jgi:outer membrane receptor protein involved in Fe transport
VRENLSLFDDRVVLNAGYSDLNFGLTLNDEIANKRYEATVDRGLVSYGIVVKPLKYVSLYFGHEQNSSANSAQTITNGGPETQDGVQNEGGVRVELLDKRLFATFDYFHIVQNNFSIGNPANNAVPPPVPTLPALYSDRLAPSPTGIPTTFRFAAPRRNPALCGSATPSTRLRCSTACMPASAPIMRQSVQETRAPA